MYSTPIEGYSASPSTKATLNSWYSFVVVSGHQLGSYIWGIKAGDALCSLVVCLAPAPILTVAQGHESLNSAKMILLFSFHQQSKTDEE